ncbi:DUF6438 domain-containing protein [Pontibacter akesuensis]|uniref:DUF6438 domain-containing protein n=1 Tax=Pontibacter akesuensis TaxID=388950 RepID=A0A1I7G9R6_9BACT|nr:DUF6438 domain-containing protein [Pontibacter akesuensis]GHA57894.1 hypothetical protein GCM10007389_07180 [Pontibacter akesuensis]SFU45168.1 hypothetical protein SAMN04487941_0849 [Pontibacter akesuensis]
MTRYKLFLLLLFVGFVLGTSGCASTTSCNVQTATNAQPVLLFQKTPCYGSCAAYNATLYADGSIRYEGIRNTPVMGELTLCLPAKQLKKVEAHLKLLDVAALKDNYLSPFTDLPSSYLTFYSQNKAEIRIKHQQDGPAELQQLIMLLDRAVTQLVQEHKQADNTD